MIVDTELTTILIGNGPVQIGCLVPNRADYLAIQRPNELTTMDRVLLLDPVLSRLSQEIEDFGERLASIAYDLEHEGTCNPIDAAKIMSALNRGDTYTIEHVVAWHWFRDTQDATADRYRFDGHMGTIEGMAA